ncbi:hypothetical protein SLE2022_182440 [Rubroshorea leprosula]
MNSPGLWKPVVVIVVVYFAFAIVNVLNKKILDKGVSPMIVVTYRQAISCVFLAPLAYFWERRSRPNLTSSILCHLFLSALLGATLLQYTFLVGLGYTSATFSCAFTNMVPAITFMLSLPFGLEKLNIKTNGGRAKIIGTLITVAGAMILTFYKGMPLGRPYRGATAAKGNQGNMMDSTKKTKNLTIGSLVLTASSIVLSCWYLLQARIGKMYPCPYSSTAFMSFFATFQSAILSLIIERDFSKWVLKGKLEIFTVTYAGIVATGLCFVGISWCVKQKGPLFTAAFNPTVQIFVAIFDFSILHAQIYFGSVLGCVLIVIGLYVLLWGKARSETEQPVLNQPQTTEETEDCNGRSQL